MLLSLVKKSIVIMLIVWLFLLIPNHHGWFVPVGQLLLGGYHHEWFGLVGWLSFVGNHRRRFTDALN